MTKRGYVDEKLAQARSLVGKHVEIPVHYDLWMRGARTGVVRSVGNSGEFVRVKMDHPQVRRLVKIWRVDFDYMKILGGVAFNRNPRTRDYRGRFKKKRYATSSEAREIFDRMYARKEAEREAYLRTPEGEAERQAFNARQLQRLKGNPRDKGTPLKRGDSAYWDSFSGLIPVRILEIRGPSGSPTSRQQIKVRLAKTVGAFKTGEQHYVSGLWIVAKEAISRRKYSTRIRPGTKFLSDEEPGNTPRELHARRNPRGRFVICAHAGKHTLYYKRSTARFIETTGDATHYKSRAIAEREAKAILHRLPSSIANLTVKSV